MERREVVRRLIRMVSRPEIDLESAFLLLARFESPELDLRPYRKVLDVMGAEVRKRFASAKDDLERCRILVGYLAKERGYRGDPRASFTPTDIYLHRAIERRCGLPLTLVSIYLFVGRRAGDPGHPRPL